MKNRIHKIIGIFIIIGAVLIDQITKYLTVVFLKPISSYPLIDGVFHLTYCENTGAAFSMLEGFRWFVIIITVIFVIFILFLVYSDRILNIYASYALIFIVAGGFGNLVDRIFQGYVVDMFDFRLINFAVFNVADIFVTCGAIGFIIIYILQKGDIVKWKK